MGRFYKVSTNTFFSGRNIAVILNKGLCSYTEFAKLD